MKRIAVIPGDGVGPEVVAVGRHIVDRAARSLGTRLEWVEFEWGSAYFNQHGTMMPSEGVDILSAFDAIYFGAVGDRSVPEHLSVSGLVLAIRQGLDQFVNYRPIRLLPGVPCPLRNVVPADIDMLFIRENVEGEYSNVGARLDEGLPTDRAMQTAVFTRRGIERVVRYAFEQASRRRGQLTSVTKSNALRFSMVLWDEVVDRVAEEFPGVLHRRMHVDAAAYHLVLRPPDFDVVVASNLFGDILTDLGAALQGSLGLAASANLDPSGRHPGMFEPVHGSAPDIAGLGVANPSGAIWAGALMLESLGLTAAADRVMLALERTLSAGGRTADLGGSLSTEEMGREVLNCLSTLDSPWPRPGHRSTHHR
jgi:tartrate dehydrogenase/decarboxylase/D-malate dehydrogenase